MKKLVRIFIIVFVILFILILCILNNDDRYINKNIEDILDKTEIGEIDYYNKYGSYYLVMDDEYLYLIDYEYKIVSKLERILIHENKNNYELVYEDGVICYFKDELLGKKIQFTYYDIYTYEEVKRVLLGG